MPFLTQGKTNWKYILIVLILAVIVGGGILGWQRWLAPKYEVSKSSLLARDLNLSEEEIREIGKCLTKKSTLKSHFCQIDLGKRFSNIKVCDYIKALSRDQAMKGMTPYPFGWTQPTFCQGGVTASKNDFSICEDLDIVNERNMCYEAAAIALNDMEVCENLAGAQPSISEEKVREFCREGVAAARGDLSFSTSTTYYAKVAALKEDISICKELPSDKIDFCLATIAILNPFSEDICQDIKDLERKNYCLGRVAAVKGDFDIDTCKQYDPTDLCYAFVAMEKRDASICKIVTSKEMQKECFDKVKGIKDLEKTWGISYQ